MIYIKKLNETFLRIVCDDKEIIAEIFDKFSYKDPTAASNWKVNKGWQKAWKRSLFNMKTRVLWIGLLPDLVEWLDDSGYEYKIEGDFQGESFSLKEAEDFIKTLNIPEKFQIRDYQLKYFVKAVRNRRCICLAPTSSGKSLIIYLLFRYFNTKTLLIVPSVNLVYQMFKDFKDYGYDVDENVHMVMGGTEKNVSSKKLTISTWQSIYQEERPYFDDIEVIIGDEVHGFKASSLVNIMTMASNTPVRIGFTGTLTGEPLYDFQIQGLFGPLFKYISTKEMMDQGYASEMEINAILLNHSNSPYRDQFLVKVDYVDEVEYLTNLPSRNKFIKNLALSLKGNTFVMFKNISHGKELFEMIKAGSEDIPVYYVSGETKGVKREDLRNIIEKSEKSIVVASTVFATGVNITSINNIIFVHPSKSRIRVMQSIGRGLRKNSNKEKLELFDIADRLLERGLTSTLVHFKERLKMYKEEDFTISFHDVNLK